MTKDDITRMAREAGFNWPEIHTTTIEERLERFANLVAEHEREECAKLCDVLAVHPEYASDVTKLAAKAIRARGNT